MTPRLRRLHADYEQLREAFSGHPHVLVEPTSSTMPPDRYLITYRLRGLTLQGAQPVFREQHQVDLQLPLKYPAEKPQAVPVEPIFHPNIREYFCIGDYWAAGTTLRDIIEMMGDMIQWKISNPKYPLDGVAAQWEVENKRTNPDIFPFGNVDLGSGDIAIGTAGGADLAGELNQQRAPAEELEGLGALDQSANGLSSGSGNGDQVAVSATTVPASQVVDQTPTPSADADGDFDIVFK